MTKSDPATWEWKAIHNHKIVDYPNYIDIDRSTLKEFQLRDGGKVLFSFKNPKKLFVRLRTQMKEFGNVLERVWIVGNSDPLEYYIVGDGYTEKFNAWGDIPRHAVEFREDEING